MDKYSGRPRLKVFSPKKLENFFELQAKTPYAKYHIEGAKKGKEYDFYFFKVQEAESKGLMTRKEGAFEIESLGGNFKIIETDPSQLRRFLAEATKIVSFVEVGGWMGGKIFSDPSPIALAILSWRDGHAEELIDIQLEFKINTDRQLRLLISRLFNEGGLPTIPPVVDVPPIVIPPNVDVPEAILSIPAVDAKASIYQKVLSRTEMINPGRFTGSNLPMNRLRGRTEYLQNRGIETAVSDKFNSLMTQAVDQFPELFEEKSSKDRLLLQLQDAFLRIKKGLFKYFTDLKPAEKRWAKPLAMAVLKSALPFGTLSDDKLSDEDIDRLASLKDKKVINALFYLSDKITVHHLLNDLVPIKMEGLQLYRNLLLKTLRETPELVTSVHGKPAESKDVADFLKEIERSHDNFIFRDKHTKLSNSHPFAYFYKENPEFKQVFDKYANLLLTNSAGNLFVDVIKVLSKGQWDRERGLGTIFDLIDTPSGPFPPAVWLSSVELPSADTFSYSMKGIKAPEEHYESLVEELTADTSLSETDARFDALAAITPSDSPQSVDGLLDAFLAKGVTVRLYGSKIDYNNIHGTDVLGNYLAPGSVRDGHGKSATFNKKYGKDPRVVQLLKGMLWALGVCQQYSGFDLKTLHLYFSESMRARAWNNTRNKSALIGFDIKDTPQTAVHEMMHSLEYYSRSVQDYVTMFFLQHIKDPPRTDDFHGDEKNFVLENAPSQYAGKFYTQSTATELVTMTVQDFATPSSLRDFAKNYPKFFLFGYNIVKGLVHIPESERSVSQKRTF